MLRLTTLLQHPFTFFEEGLSSRITTMRSYDFVLNTNCIFSRYRFRPFLPTVVSS